MRLGFWEIVVVLVVALILFGPNRLPEMGKSLGKALREFRQATSDLGAELSQAQEALQIDPPKAKPAERKPAAADDDSAAAEPAAEHAAEPVAEPVAEPAAEPLTASDAESQGHAAPLAEASSTESQRQSVPEGSDDEQRREPV